MDCCVVKRENTIPPGDKTRYSHPKCYARALNDCSEDISAEHFMSKSVLKLIEAKGGQFTISGPRWVKENEERKVSIESLGTNVLCKRHNHALSGLDNLARIFFEFLIRKNKVSEYLMINGDEIERWMLKVLCGQISSGWASEELRYWQPPIEWLDILFGTGKLPNESGMYALKGKDIHTKYHQEGAFLIENEQKTLINGLYFIIAGFQFLFFVGAPDKRTLKKFYSDGWDIHYRPECIVIVFEDSQQEIHLGPPPRSGFYVMKIPKVPTLSLNTN